MWAATWNPSFATFWRPPSALVKEQHTARVHQRARERTPRNGWWDLIVKPIRKKTNPLDILLGNKPKEPELPP